MQLVLFLAGVFVITLILGRLLEKIRIPWIFAALLIGLGLAAYNPFGDVTSSPEFLFLANLGMYFLLFIIGFELDIKELKDSSVFILKATVIIILSEALMGSFLVHYFFGLPWVTAFLLSLSFATVGEAVLLPIFDDLKITKTRFGQTALAIGALDDVFEVATIIAISVLLGYSTGHGSMNVWLNIIVLVSLFALTFLVIHLRKFINHFKYHDISMYFLISIILLFTFIGIGSYVESAALGALLAGISLRYIAPKRTMKYLESDIKTLAYGFLAPIFFLWVGVDVNIPYLLKYPLLILMFMCAINITKILSSIAIGRKEMGTKKSFLLGIALSVKFSTSIVILKLLLEKGVIQSDVYSVLIGTQILFKFVLPFLLSYLITRWDISFTKNISRVG